VAVVVGMGTLTEATVVPVVALVGVILTATSALVEAQLRLPVSVLWVGTREPAPTVTTKMAAVVVEPVVTVKLVVERSIPVVVTVARASRWMNGQLLLPQVFLVSMPVVAVAVIVTLEALETVFMVEATVGTLLVPVLLVLLTLVEVAVVPVTQTQLLAVLEVQV
jgi:hypothetical protein